MSNSPRLAAILPLKVVIGADDYTHFAHTLDISSSGVRLIMPMALDTGSDVTLEYRNNRARAVVVWSKPKNRNTRDHEVGMRLLDDGQRFWLAEFAPKAQVLGSMGQRITERARK